MGVTLLLPVPSRPALIERSRAAWEERDQGRQKKRRMAVATVLLVLAVRSPCCRRRQGSVLQLGEGRQEGKMADSRQMAWQRSARSELPMMLPMLLVMMMPQARRQTMGF